MINKFDSWKDHNDTLNGERIKQINLLIGDEELYIKTDKRIHKFRVEGDCCSHSYFYEIQNVSQMITWIVTDIEKIEFNLPNDSDELCTYAYKIHTEGGYCLIVFRNESNGYYGGSLEYDGIVDYTNGIEIKDDWNL